MAWRCSGNSNQELVKNLLAANIIKTKRVEHAMSQVDRFYYAANKGQAYQDAPHGIGSNATISAPHMHASCLEYLLPSLKEGSCVLDVGCGSGYLTSCFAKLVGPTGKVVGIGNNCSFILLKKNLLSGDL